MEGLAATLEPRQRSIGWVVAPTYDLADKVFREIVIIAAEHLRHRIVSIRENDRRLVLRNMAGAESEVRAKSADNPISLLGEGLDWLVVDEAARLKPVIWEAYLSQRLLDKNGWALLISTPAGKGWYYDLYRRGQRSDPDYHSWNSPSRMNPHLNPELIERERARLPDRVFRQEYEGEFIEGAGQVFRCVRERATGDWKEPVPGERYVAGLDLAKIEDFTVLVIVNRQREVVFVDRFHRLDWAIQVSRIKAALERYNSATVLVDSTGAGEPVFESLLSAGCRAHPYSLTQSSKGDIVNNLALMLEQGRLVLPKPILWPEGIEEVEAFEFSISDGGNIKTGAPSGVHDDCVIALALAAWEARNFRPPSGRPPVRSVSQPVPQLGFRRMLGIAVAGPWLPKEKWVDPRGEEPKTE